jgi:ketosteroid isomerase-like protein
MKFSGHVLAGLLAVAWWNAVAAQTPTPAFSPMVDHHQHLMSPAAAAFLSTPEPGGELLPEVTRVLERRGEHWNQAASLERVYTDDSIVFSDLGPEWVRGRSEVAKFVSTRFARPYRLTPQASLVRGARAQVAGYYTRGEGEAARHFGQFHLDLERGSDGAWRIAVERSTFPAPQTDEAITGENLVSVLDAAGVSRAVVLSVAYWFDGSSSPGRTTA